MKNQLGATAPKTRRAKKAATKKAPPAFKKFESTLRKESESHTEADLEAGLVEPKKCVLRNATIVAVGPGVQLKPSGGPEPRLIWKPEHDSDRKSLIHSAIVSEEAVEAIQNLSRSYGVSIASVATTLGEIGALLVESNDCAALAGKPRADFLDQMIQLPKAKRYRRIITINEHRISQTAFEFSRKLGRSEALCRGRLIEIALPHAKAPALMAHYLGSYSKAVFKVAEYGSLNGWDEYPESLDVIQVIGDGEHGYDAEVPRDEVK